VSGSVKLAPELNLKRPALCFQWRGVNRKCKILLAVLLATLGSASLWVTRSQTYYSGNRRLAQQITRGSYDELVNYAKFAVSRNYNALQLLRDMSRQFTSQGHSIEFSGEDVRQLATKYSMGNDVALALLPLKSLKSVTLGAGPNGPQFTILLSRPTTTTFRYMCFKIKLYLSQSYGVYLIGDNVLDNIRGVQAEGPAGVADVLSLDLSRSPSVRVKLSQRPYPSVTVSPIRERGRESLSVSSSALTHLNTLQQEQVRAALDQALLYLEKTQKKETSGSDYFQGEWPSYMDTRGTIPTVGKKGKFAYDSNSFTVSSIHNALAATFLRLPELTAIPSLLDRAIERILSYQNGNSFNFWPLLEPPSNLKLKWPVMLRRPNHYSIHNTLTAGFFNVVNDSDDTAAALLAISQYQQIRPDVADKIILPRTIGNIFSAYRDRNRPFSHPYNQFQRMTRTGAFLTWLAREHSLRPGAILPSLKHPNIPIGVNDVDCVVNANILATLAHFNELGTQGTRESCRLINSAFQRGLQKSCGVYYPSPYNLHYATAKAIAAGAQCLTPSVRLLVQEILDEQNSDGSWNSPLVGDQVHSSLYALNALSYLQNQTDEKTRERTRVAVDQGIAYIIQEQRAYEDGGSFWPAGVSFSGGTIVRKKIVWRSEAHTTALASEVLSLWIQQHRSEEALQ